MYGLYMYFQIFSVVYIIGTYSTCIVRAIKLQNISTHFFDQKILKKTDDQFVVIIIEAVDNVSPMSLTS